MLMDLFDQTLFSCNIQSANYYNDLLGMSVPVPPSVEDFTKTVYTFTDGALTNEITSMIAQPNGNYSVSYLSSYTQSFSVVSNPSSRIVTKSGTSSYSIGKDSLRKLGSVYENKEGIGFRWNADIGRYETDVYTWSYYDADRNMNLIGPTFFKNKNGKYQKGVSDDGNSIYYTFNGTTFNGFPCEKQTFIIPYDTHNEIYTGDVNFTSTEYTLEFLREKYTHSPKSRIYCIENLHLALQFMEKEMKVRNPGCSAEDIIDADKNGIKLVLGLLWTLFRKFRMNPVDLVGTVGCFFKTWVSIVVFSSSDSS